MTFGHGTVEPGRIADLLRGAGTGLVVDVRRFPGSRRQPHVAREAMAQWLPAAGIAYRWEPALGGRRRPPPDAPGQDPWWQVEAFRGYAAHTRSTEFGTAMADLLRDVAAGRGRTVVMCSESVWWRCHRRLVADVAVLLHAVPVLHLGHDGRLTGHRPSAGARTTPDGLRYDVVPEPPAEPSGGA